MAGHWQAPPALVFALQRRAALIFASCVMTRSWFMGLSPKTLPPPLRKIDITGVVLKGWGRDSRSLGSKSAYIPDAAGQLSRSRCRAALCRPARPRIGRMLAPYFHVLRIDRRNLRPNRQHRQHYLVSGGNADGAAGFYGPILCFIEDRRRVDSR